MKLKGLKLYILGLIGGLIFLPSFSSSYTAPTYSIHSVNALNGIAYQVGVLPLGNVHTIHNSERKYVFAPSSQVIFFWDFNNDPVLITPKDYSCLTDGTFRYYRICDEIVDSFNDSMCGSFQLIDKSYLSSFLGTIDSSDNWAYFYREGSQGTNSFGICFSSHKKGKSICFGIVNSIYNSRCYQPNPADNPYPSNMFTGTKYEYNFDSLPATLIGYSPISDLPPTYLEDGGYTNGEVADGYGELGRYPTYCYSDFSLFSLTDMDGTIDQFYETELDDGEYYTGATIFDLYQQYYVNTSMSIPAFLERNYSYYTIASDRGFLPSYYSNKSKGLGSIGYKTYLAQRNVRNFNFNDYVNYCRFRVNYDPEVDSGDVYNGPGLPDDVGDKIDSDQQVRICTENPESAFCSGNIGSGGAGGGSKSVGFHEFYNNIFSLLSHRKSIGYIEREPILPTYIIIGFLAFVLLYLFRR